MTEARHRVWRFGANIDTDVLAPGAYMKLSIQGIAPHCLESVRPEFAAQVKPGDVLVAGPGFGIGSSREQAAAALAYLGVAAVIAPSYSGLFFRNAFNLGLLLLTCPAADLLRETEPVGIDLMNLQIISPTHGKLAIEPIADFLLAMVRAGGLLQQLKNAQLSSAIQTQHVSPKPA